MAARFKTSEQESAYFSALGRKSAEGRIVLSSDEADKLRRIESALHEAYTYILSISPKLEKPNQPEDSAA